MDEADDGDEESERDDSEDPTEDGGLLAKS